MRFMPATAFTCVLCRKKGKELNCHHVLRWADRPELRYLTSNGVTLCKDCHNLVTGNENAYVQQFKNHVERKKFEKKFSGGKINKTTKKTIEGQEKGKWIPKNYKMRW